MFHMSQFLKSKKFQLIPIKNEYVKSKYCTIIIFLHVEEIFLLTNTKFFYNKFLEKPTCKDKQSMLKFHIRLENLT